MPTPVYQTSTTYNGSPAYIGCPVLMNLSGILYFGHVTEIAGGGVSKITCFGDLNGGDTFPNLSPPFDTSAGGPTGLADGFWMFAP